MTTFNLAGFGRLESEIRSHQVLLRDGVLATLRACTPLGEAGELEPGPSFDRWLNAWILETGYLGSELLSIVNALNRTVTFVSDLDDRIAAAFAGE